MTLKINVTITGEGTAVCTLEDIFEALTSVEDEELRELYAKEIFINKITSS